MELAHMLPGRRGASPIDTVRDQRVLTDSRPYHLTMLARLDGIVKRVTVQRAG